MERSEKNRQRVYTMTFAKVYPLYIEKARKKGRSKEEVDEIIRWITGYSSAQLEEIVQDETDLEDFFMNAPAPPPERSLIRGVVCGVRVEEISDPILKEVRYLDKLIDELAKGKAMEKILRTPREE